MIERGQFWSLRAFTARYLAGTVALVLLASCGSARSEPTPLPPAPTEQESPMPTGTPADNTPTPEAEAEPEPLPQAVLRAVEAAALDAGVDQADVQILSFTERNWPSTALGCPQPGFSYAQVVTPGYEVLLRIGDQEYAYHTNMTAAVVLCSGG